jgi:hypothetical protein
MSLYDSRGGPDRFRGHPTPGARCTTHPDAAAEGSCARCGDFVCRLCGPLEPVALCPRCALKTTLDWEEPGDHGPVRAFVLTLREAIGSPSRVGARLGGSGHVLAALSYVTACGVCGLFPLSLVLAVPLVSVANPYELGLRSTGALSVGVSLVLFSVAAATLLALVVALLAGTIWSVARALGVSARYDVQLRATAYGVSMVALPLIGPVLLPLALVQSLLMNRAVLRARSDAGRALVILVVTLVLCVGASLGWRALLG